MRGKNHPISLLFTRHDDFVKWADKYRVPDINKYLHCNDDTITFF
ncbi:hypothetical protein V6Z12_D06G138000 [Gossypium hirsutum]